MKGASCDYFVSQRKADNLGKQDLWQTFWQPVLKDYRRNLFLFFLCDNIFSSKRAYLLLKNVSVLSGLTFWS